MEQIVRVRRVYDNGMAQVLKIRESACSGDCHKCAGCGAAQEAVLVEAVNAIDAKCGELVVVESATGPVLKAAAILYVLPLATFFLGYFLGALLGIGALAGCLGFLLGFVPVVLYDRNLAKKKETVYTITGYPGESGKNIPEKGDNDLG